MATYTWSGGSGLWGTAGNWGPPGGPPDTTLDMAQFNGNSTYTATIADNTAFAVGGVTLDNPNATLDILGALDIGPITGAGTLTISAGTLIDGASGDITVSASTLATLSGTLVEAGGSFTTSGTFNIDNGGTLSGYGMLTGGFNDNGLIVASSGLLSISGGVSDTGFGSFIGGLLVTNGATLTVGGGVTAPLVTFASSGANETFGFGTTTGNATEVQGFATTNTIELIGVSDVDHDINVAYSDGTITVERNTTFLASFTVFQPGTADYSTANYYANPDANGDTVITTTAITSFTWQGTGTGDWGLASNWTPSGGPPDGPTAQAVFTGNSVETATVNAGETITAGAVTLDDPSATLSIGGVLDLGALVTPGTLALAAGTLNVTGSLVAVGANIDAADNDFTIEAGGTFSAGYTGITGSLDVDGDVVATAGTLAIGGNVGGTASVSAGLIIDPGAAITVTGSVTAANVTFSPGTGETFGFDTFNNSTLIHGFFAGNTIWLQNVTDTDNDVSGTYSDSTGLSVVQNGVTLESIDLRPSSAYTSGTQFDFTSDQNGGTDVTTSVACYAAGTRIATPDGEVAIEALRAGDRVVTASGAARPIRWLGYRTVDVSRHPRPWDVMPVRVRADAFGPARPARDLILSPDHAVFTEGVLIPIRYLLNAATIVQETADRVTWWHVELDAHDVILAENLPAESFLDTGNRGAFANGGAVVMAHPDFARDAWARGGCAALVTAGDALRRARKNLLSRMPELGHFLTEDQDLRVFAGTIELDPQCDAGWLCVVVPDDADMIRLVSRAARPAETDPDSDDWRMLGAAVTAIAMDGETIRLDDPRLREGWLKVEQGLRWTDGAARIDVTPGAVLEIWTARLLSYHVAAPRGVIALAA